MLPYLQWTGKTCLSLVKNVYTRTSAQIFMVTLLSINTISTQAKNSRRKKKKEKIKKKKVKIQFSKTSFNFLGAK